jgi:carbon storage regulator
MLYLTRKIGESIIINDDIEVTVVEIRGKSIKLGLTFPAEATVYRREVHERILAERRAGQGQETESPKPEVVIVTEPKARKTGT